MPGDPTTENELLICALLSSISGLPIGPEDVYLAVGGSLEDLPRIVCGLEEAGLPVPPLLSLFTYAPVEVFARKLEAWVA